VPSSRIIARQQAAPYEETQQALAHRRRYRCDGDGLEAAGGMEDHGVRRRRIEHAVDDDTVKMEVGIERRAEAMTRAPRRARARSALSAPATVPCE
jgi:hypothetical protein